MRLRHTPVIEPATHADLRAMARVERKASLDTFRFNGIKKKHVEAWDWTPEHRDVKNAGFFLDNPEGMAWVLKVRRWWWFGKKVVGFIGVSTNSPDKPSGRNEVIYGEPNNPKLEKLYILKRHRRHEAGKRLAATALHWLQDEKGAERVKLETAVKTLGPEFYKGIGFERTRDVPLEETALPGYPHLNMRVQEMEKDLTAPDAFTVLDAALEASNV